MWNHGFRGMRVLATAATLSSLAVLPPAGAAGLDLPRAPQVPRPPQAPQLPDVEAPAPATEALGTAAETVDGLANGVAPGVIPPAPGPAPAAPPPAGGGVSPVNGSGGEKGGSPAKAAGRSGDRARVESGSRADRPARRGRSRASEGRSDRIEGSGINDAVTTVGSGFGGPLIEALEALPWSLLVAIVGLALLGLAMAGRSARLSSLTSRLRKDELVLRDDVGALQDALLPRIPERIGAVDVSVAYRAADGPAAGGDFHDILPLSDGRVGVIVGDVSGHGRQALAATALVHYTVRAHLEADLRPCQVLRLADAALAGKLHDRYATVLVAVYDPSTSTLDYATAGHPAPLIRGEARDHAVEALAPPVGLGPPAGPRETRVSIERGSSICFFTDGLIEARDEGGQMVEREGLASILGALEGRIDVAAVLDRLPAAGTASDDLTVCLLQPLAASGDGRIVEEIEVDPSGSAQAIGKFLAGCGLPDREIRDALAEVERCGLHGERPVLRIERLPSGSGRRIDVSPPSRPVSRRARRASRRSRSRLPSPATR